MKLDLALKPRSMRYAAIQDPGVAVIDWHGTTSETADELLAMPASAEERTAVYEAAAFLID